MNYLFMAIASDVNQTLWTSSEAEPSGTGESGAATTESKEAAPEPARETPAGEPEKAAE